MKTKTERNDDQLKMFLEHQHIPQWLADYFSIANSGNYADKQIFYKSIKPIILKKYGEFAGYDLQIIKHKCYSCGGTGIYKHYNYEFGQRFLIHQEECYNCNKGIYSTKKIYLERYILNNGIYHIPIIIHLDNIPVVKVINGVILHDNVDHKEAMKAFIILLWKYNRPIFYDYIIDLMRLKVTLKQKWLNELIQTIFRKQNTNDELPF